jgi:hypothetical protein
MFPARFAPFAFGFALPGLMPSMAPGIAAFRTAGRVDGLAALAPVARRAGGRLVKP